MVYNFIRFSLFALFISFAGLNAYAPQFEEMRVGWIDIKVSGPSNDSKEQLVTTIRNRLKTKQGDSFSQAAFDADLKMLVQDYDRIEPVVEIRDGKIHIELRIWPNPTILRIRWEGNQRIGSNKLKSELGIEEGTIFDREKFNEAFHNVKAYYVQKGFFEAELDYTIVQVEDTNSIVVNICIQEGRAGRIRDIVFTNFTEEEQKCILAMMVTKPHNLFLSWATGTGTYNDDMILHDKFQILNYIQNQGYADAKVNIEVFEAAQDDRIILSITLDRGKIYYFDEITVKGNTIYSTEEILQCIPAQIDTPYAPDKLIESTQVIANLYGSNGYIDTFVNYIPRLDTDGCSYKVEIHIEEGEQYRVGLIKIIGNRCTKSKVILHETLLVPGEIFNLEMLKITERRLSNIGYFDSVNVYAVKSSDEDSLPGCYRDVHIEVEEGSTGNLGASVGFSTSEDVFASITLTECNFNIKGLQCFSQEGLCGLRGGGEFAHLALSIGAKSSKYALSWTKPYYMDTPWSVGFDIDRSYKAYMSNDYSITSVGLALHATYECNAFTRVGTHYRLRYSNVNYLKNEDETPSGSTVKEAEESDGMISALGYSWQYNTTNHPFTPSRGLRSALQFEVAGLGGDAYFLSFAYLNTWYYNLWNKLIFKARGDFRFIQPLKGQKIDRIPLDERFFLGGDNLVRGYHAYHLGPVFTDLEGGKVVKDYGDPKGGIAMQLYTFELSRPMLGLGDGFVFFDAGALSEHKWDFGYLYCSYGFGARIQVFGNGSPPLMIGYGWPINPVDDRQVKNFFITVGGKF